MSKPVFTPEEQFYIHHIKTQDGPDIGFDLAYLLPALAFLVFGICTQNTLACVIAFAGIVFFKLWEWRQRAKWNPVLRSILQKYEEAVAELAQAHDGQQPSEQA